MDYDWLEEAAANTQIVEVERQARLSRRRPGSKWICTTTPRPLKTIRDWVKDPNVRISRATSHDNKHGDPMWRAELEKIYKGTRLYRQEVLGEILEDVDGAMWNVSHLDRSRIPDLAAFYEMLAETGRTVTRAAVGVDPANSTGTTGIVSVLISNDRHLYVVQDSSKPGRSAEQWARVAVDDASEWSGVLVPENDSGGDAIRAVLKAADLLDEVTIMPATARGRGSKGVRAEPIALLWERDDFRGHIVGSFPLLEDELTTFVPDAKGQESPDRLDAMVWACTYLWARASFGDVSSSWPNSAYGQPGSVRTQRPGEVLPWRARSRHAKKEKAG
jgi:phage terminase large subunit-like protein